MAATNGSVSDAPLLETLDSTTAFSAKRKREDSIDGLLNGTIHSTASNQESQSVESVESVVRDLIDVLRIHDTTPSILSREIPNSNPDSEPQLKRQKADDSQEEYTNILERLSTNLYHDLNQVLADIDRATTDITNKLRLANGSSQNHHISMSANQSETLTKVAAFRKRAHELVRREYASKQTRSVSQGNVLPNVVGGAGTNSPAHINAGSDGHKIVLTLYGNAPGPKQLFSSLQIPTQVAGESKDILQTIREAGLPNGISTTQIIPIQSTGLVTEKKRVATLGELFPTPTSVPALLPPKPSKVSTTRSSIVGWYNPNASDSHSRNASYFKQSISAGQWLDYSNVASLQQSRKKQRERTLSFAGSRTSLEVDPSESEASKLETLFRSAYSSFAPSRDDSAAVAPAGVVEKIWWQQSGEKSFARLVENYDNLEVSSAADDSTANNASEDMDDLQMFEQLVKDIENDPVDPALLALDMEAEKSIEEKDVEEILQGISELLDTLNSYQRIRHSSLNSSSRPTGLLSAPDTTFLGTPTKPSEPEQNTYEILKSQLTLMIASLPPYAVAKLDPDQLAELSISTKIEVHLADHGGIMEEDEAAARAKVAAMSVSTSTTRTSQPAPLHRPNPTALYGNQYSSTPRSNSTSHQYYGSAQTPIRPPSTNLQRPPATAPVPYQAPRPVSSAPYRPSSYGTPTYPHQASRPVQQQSYTPQAQHQYAQQTPIAQPYMRPAGQGYQVPQQSSTSGAMNGRYANHQSYPHQTAPAQNGVPYQYSNGTSSTSHQSSPQKPLYHNSPQPTPSQIRPPYSTPTAPAIVPPIRQAYHTSSMPASEAVSLVPPPLPATTTNYSTFMSQEQQANIMVRQRAELAHIQASAQQQARTAMQQSAAIGGAAQGVGQGGQQQGVNGNSNVSGTGYSGVATAL